MLFHTYLATIFVLSELFARAFLAGTVISALATASELGQLLRIHIQSQMELAVTRVAKTLGPLYADASARHRYRFQLLAIGDVRHELDNSLRRRHAYEIALKGERLQEHLSVAFSYGQVLL